MQTEKRFWNRNLAIILVFSALGSLSSVSVGYFGRLLSTLTIFSFVVPQLLSGLHVFWLILIALIVPTRGSATLTGALKGLIEASLFSHIGIFSFAVSLMQGAVVDIVFAIPKTKRRYTAYVAGGLSSASNFIFVQFFFLPTQPTPLYASAYLAALLSGVIFGGYLATRILKVMPANFKTLTTN
ncbi:MAG: ECF transporter S component [Candidatus Bathyarchaeota archaeon]|nr:ECF transporter S component [Candidatus Bathyarchaeota archaeon]